MNKELKCSICNQVYNNEGFQCINGHIICISCSINISTCPHCGVPFKYTKTRNRGLDGLLKNMKLDCANKSEGCTVSLSGKEIAVHLENCPYRAIKFCEVLDHSCGFTVSQKNIADIVPHLQDLHDVITLYQNETSFVLRKVEYGKSTCFTPTIIDLEQDYGAKFLVLFFYNREDISMHCIKITGSVDESSSENFRVEFRVRKLKSSYFPDLTWITSPIHIIQSTPTIKNSMFRLPHAIMPSYMKDGKVTMNVSIFKTSQ